MMSKGTKISLTIFFLLRFFQLVAVSIGGFVYTYLIWHHNNHYCAYYPSSCSESEMKNLNVPWQYILVTFTGTLCFVDVIITSCYFLVKAQRVEYNVVLVIESVLLVLYAVGLKVIFGVDGSPSFCFIFQEPYTTSEAGNVAARNCVIGQDGKVVLGFCVLFTGLLVLQSLIILLWDKYKVRLEAARAARSSNAVAPVLNEKTEGPQPV